MRGSKEFGRGEAEAGLAVGTTKGGAVLAEAAPGSAADSVGGAAFVEVAVNWSAELESGAAADARAGAAMDGASAGAGGAGLGAVGSVMPMALSASMAGRVRSSWLQIKVRTEARRAEM